VAAKESGLSMQTSRRGYYQRQKVVEGVSSGHGSHGQAVDRTSRNRHLQCPSNLSVRRGCGLRFSSGIELASESELKSELVFSSSSLPISASSASVSLTSFRLPIIANAECLRFLVSGWLNFYILIRSGNSPSVGGVQSWRVTFHS